MHRPSIESTETHETGTDNAGAGRFGLAGRALTVYLLTVQVVLVGVVIGGILKPAKRPHHCPQHVPLIGDPVVDALTLWDSQWYLEIAWRGYTYDRNGMAAVAFFPAYPLLVRAVQATTTLPFHWAGLLVSHVLVVAAFALLLVYARQRSPDRQQLALYALLALALFPTGFFMRMAYTESLFLSLCLAAFLGMERRWPIALIALVVGAATATRSVGVAMLLPLALHIWERSGSWRQAAARLAWAGPLAVWGIAAYVAFQWWAFDEPLTFVKAQQFWRLRPPLPPGETALTLLSWEPIWSVYLPGVTGYWAHIDPGVPLALSYHSANCVVFVGAVALVVLGAVKHWLNGREVIFAALLLAIPYVMAGYRFCMASQGRYASVVFPIYLVLGQLLCRMPMAGRVGVLAVFAFYLTAFSAMLAAGYLTI